MMIITEAVCCKTYTFGVFEIPPAEFAIATKQSSNYHPSHWDKVGQTV